MLDNLLYMATGLGLCGLCGGIFIGFCALLEQAYYKFPFVKRIIDELS